MMQWLSQGLDVEASEFRSNLGMDLEKQAFVSGPVKCVEVC